VAFAGAIEQLARDVSRRREMAARAIARVRTHFTVDVAVEKTMAIYESLLKAGSTRKGVARGAFREIDR
jgi:glycosyltransferase involved in cell wall biosynthesis